MFVTIRLWWTKKDLKACYFYLMFCVSVYFMFMNCLTLIILSLSGTNLQCLVRIIRLKSPHTKVGSYYLFKIWNLSFDCWWSLQITAVFVSALRNISPKMTKSKTDQCVLVSLFQLKLALTSSFLNRGKRNDETCSSVKCKWQEIF